jgi:hypothetical protein
LTGVARWFLFRPQKYQLVYILVNLGIENVKYYGHLEYFTTIGYISWAFTYFVVIWYIFPSLGISYQENSGNPVFDLFFSESIAFKVFQMGISIGLSTLLIGLEPILFSVV